MGNPYNGDIYRLGEGEEPAPGHVLLTEAEAALFKELPRDERIRKLREKAADVATQRELPRYRSHKVVGALKIKSIDDPNGATDGSRLLSFEEEGYAPVCVDGDWMRRHRPEVGGYYVVYRDGYKSFSPAQAFEEGYTPEESGGHVEQAVAGPPWRDVAASAYRAYAASLGRAPAYEPLPAWDELAPEIRTAVEAAVRQAGNVLSGGSYGLDTEQAWQGWEPPGSHV